MIRRLTEDNRGIAIIVDHPEEDNNPFCPNCQEIGKLSRLKERICLDDKGKLLPPPPDNDSWLQCWKCGVILPVREVQKEGKITGISGVDPIVNPFDFNKKIVTGLDNKHLQSRLKKRKKEQNKHPDPTIQAYIKDGWELQSYSSSMPT